MTHQLDMFQRDIGPSPADENTTPDLKLRYYQQEAREAVAKVHARSRGALVVLATGCHARGQGIMRHDGTVVSAEDVVVGDRLMGPDSASRTVLGLVRGHGAMARIIPVKGRSFVVNLDHILTLIRTGDADRPGSELVDVSVRDWLAWPKHRKHVHKLLRCAVDFPARPNPLIAPYVLGALIGDGCLRRTVEICTPDSEIWPECQVEAERHGLTWRRRVGCKVPTFAMSGNGGPFSNPIADTLSVYGLRVNSEHKFIPDDYKFGTRAVRLDLLAGIMDTDGHAVSGCYDYVSSSERLANDVAFVARSVGLAAYVVPKRSSDQHGTWGDYWRVCISGHCSIIPCRVSRKRHAPRAQKKDVLRTGFSVELLPEDDYYGFVVDGDQRYLLDDFTVTHNCGKTRTFGAIAWDHKLRGSKVLVLCPTIVLCQQMYEDLRKLGLRVGLEQASNRVERPLPDVLVASVATMRGARLKAFDPNDFGLVCSDEAHRSTSAAQRAIYAHFTGAKRLGLTATPDRTDGVSLANVFDEVAYDMPMLAGIQQGYLAPLKFILAQTDFDPSRIRSIAGDVDPGSVADELVRSGCLHQAANTLAEVAPTRRTVAFLPTVAASKAFVSELNARNVRPDGHIQFAVHIDASTPECMREQVFADFRDGKCQVISNVGLLIEGWDGPWTECIALLNPTKSRSRVAQMIGRGTRPHEGKEDCLVVDFCHGRLKKGRLASPADALAGKMLPDDVIECMATQGDIATEVTRAELKAAELEKLRAEREARALERAQRRDKRKDLVRKQRFVFGVAELDLHELFGTTNSGKLMERLAEHGVDIPKAEDDRRRQNLCSLKQANLLAKYGMEPNLSRKLASEAITMLAENKWRMSEAIKARKSFWPAQ